MTSEICVVTFFSIFSSTLSSERTQFAISMKPCERIKTPRSVNSNLPCTMVTLVFSVTASEEMLARKFLQTYSYRLLSSGYLDSTELRPLGILVVGVMGGWSPTSTPFLGLLMASLAA